MVFRSRHKLIRGVTVLGVVVLCACAAAGPWPAHYLNEKMDHATQDEILAQLGRPYETHALPGGGVTWHYHQRRGRPMIGAHGTIGGSGISECGEYILRFDPSGVLRAWRQTAEPVCESET